MNTEDAGPHEKDCCKVAILAYKQKVSLKNSNLDLIQSRAIMVLMAIGIPLMFILDPQKVWIDLDAFMVGLSVVGWLGLIVEFRKWMKARKSIK